MSIRYIFSIFIWGLAITQTYGQVIADFTFDDTSDIPASLLINRVGENAVSINPNARSDGEGAYTQPDPENPEKDQWIDLQVPERIIDQLKNIQMEFDYRCQEDFAWMINAGFNRFRFGHHVNGGGFHVRYVTTADPDKIISSDFVGALSRNERATVVFAYNYEIGTAYIIKNGQIIWETPEEEKTPGETLIWNTENGNFSVGSSMHGEGSTIPSLYRFRVYELLCLDILPPTVKNDTICGSGQAQLRASGGHDGQYRWYKGAGEDISLLENELNSTFSTELLNSTTNYYVSLTTEECESALVPVQVVVKQKPEPPRITYSAPCGPGESMLYVEDSLQDLRYSWYTHPDSAAIHQGNSLPIQLLGDSLLYVRSNSGHCNSEAVPIELRPNELPSIDAGLDRTILKGESIDLLASGNFESVHWQPHESLQYGDTKTPRVSPEFTHTYMVTAISAEGCENTDTLTIYVIDEFPVPNAFTPNKDGRNDTWKIPNIENYPDCRIDIFNRWGNQVFSSKGYTQPWDGTHQGRELPSDTYYYTLKLNHEKEPVKGTVVLIR